MPCDIGLRAWLLCHTLGDSDRCATALHNPADLKGAIPQHNRAAQSCSTIVQVFQRPNAATVLSYGRNLTTELYVNDSMATPMATPIYIGARCCCLTPRETRTTASDSDAAQCSFVLQLIQLSPSLFRPHPPCLFPGDAGAVGQLPRLSLLLQRRRDRFRYTRRRHSFGVIIHAH